MELITLNPESLEKEHICCAFADKKCASGYQNKKEWLKERFSKGYRFKRLNERGKVLIEYAPAEEAWVPVHAPGYTMINCFWVSGSYKGQGWGTALLKEVESESENSNGLVILSSVKKRPYLSDKKFLLRNGFEICDSADPYFELLVKKNRSDAETPQFTQNVKNPSFDFSDGLDIFYSYRCPFAEYYIKTELCAILTEENIPFKLHHLNTQKKAFDSPCANTIVTMFYKGRFLTHEFTTVKRFPKLKDRMDAIDKGGPIRF